MLSTEERLATRAMRALALKDYARALRLLRALLREREPTPEILSALGLCHARTGDREAAEACARDALALDGAHFAALRLASDLALEREALEEARALARRALERLGDDVVRGCVAPGPVAARLRRWWRRMADPRDPRLSYEEREWVRWACVLIEHRE